jgi:type 1 glutamine amidotransferase
MHGNPKRYLAMFAIVFTLTPLMLHSQDPAAPRPAAGAAASGAQGQAHRAQPAGGPLCNDPCDPYPRMKKLLIVADVQTGFQHDSINHTMGVLEEMGRKTGIYVTYLRTDSQLITKGKITGTSKRYANRSINARNLNYFDAVLLLGSGDSTMSDEQKADLLSFVHDDGKGLLLGHAEGVNLLNWTAFGDMVGGYMAKEYPATGMYARVVDPGWKDAAAFGKEPFFWADQWPVLQPQFKLGSVHTIIALDALKMTPEQRAQGRPDDYYPIVWAKYYGKGRVFDFTGGHNDQTLDDPRTQALWLEGIEWALGITNEDATPDKMMFK